MSSIVWTINQWIVPDTYVVRSWIESNAGKMFIWRQHSEISFELRHEHFSGDTFDTLTITCRSASVTPVTENGNKWWQECIPGREKERGRQVR